MQEHTCCFFGHREIHETDKLKQELYAAIEHLVLHECIDTFLFGSKSRFNSLCHEQVTTMRERYPHIKRIYVRAEFPHINESYTSYLLQSYEGTYFPEKALGAGKAVYVERNRDMINKSRFCIVYCQEGYLPKNRKSGTQSALDYAVMRGKQIIRLPK